MDENKMQESIRRNKITSSEEYQDYLKALFDLAWGYIPQIRKQFADRAYEKYQDETTRRIVLAYGKEREEAKDRIFRQFQNVSKYDDWSSEEFNYEVSCLNMAASYGNTIKMLFDIA